jgi:hypothetical protein
MKKLVLTLCFLWSAAALGQSVSNTVQMSSTFQTTSHAEHASPHALAQEQTLLAGPGWGYTIAEGERPLWEFASSKPEVPLGDVARAYREQHETAKKARFVRQD